MEKMTRAKRGSGCIYRIKKDSGNWYLKYHVNGKAQYENSGSQDRRIAEKILKQRLAKKTLGQLLPGATKITFENMEEDIINDYKINGRKSLDRVKLSIENLRESFAGNRAENITTDRIKIYVCEAQAEGAANATVNRDLPP